MTLVGLASPEQIGRSDGACDEPAEALEEEGEVFEECRGCRPLRIAGGVCMQWASQKERAAVDRRLEPSLPRCIVLRC